MLPEDNLRLYDSACAGKIRFPSEGAAVGFLEKGLAVEVNTRRAHRIRGMAHQLGAYLCKFHEPGDQPHWHTGHE